MLAVLQSLQHSHPCFSIDIMLLSSTHRAFFFRPPPKARFLFTTEFVDCGCSDDSDEPGTSADSAVISITGHLGVNTTTLLMT